MNFYDIEGGVIAREKLIFIGDVFYRESVPGYIFQVQTEENVFYSKLYLSQVEAEDARRQIIDGTD